MIDFSADGATDLELFLAGKDPALRHFPLRTE